MKTRGNGQRSAACKAHCLLYHRKGIFCYPYLSKYTYRKDAYLKYLFKNQIPEKKHKDLKDKEIRYLLSREIVEFET